MSALWLIRTTLRTVYEARKTIFFWWNGNALPRVKYSTEQKGFLLKQIYLDALILLPNTEYYKLVYATHRNVLGRKTFDVTRVSTEDDELYVRRKEKKKKTGIT